MQSFDVKAIALATDGRLIGNSHIQCKDILINSNIITEDSLFIAIKGERFDGHDFILDAFQKGAAAVISQKPIDIPNGCAAILVDDTRLALGRLAKWHRDTLDVQVIGVTGSVGKTSTKEFIYSVLKQKYHTYRTQGNLNNDIGMPISLLQIEPSCQCAVIEMGMNHFLEIDYLTSIARPNIAVITNIGVAHIENLGSREGILKAKLEILNGMGRHSSVVVNGDEPLLFQEKKHALEQFRPIYYGIENDACNIWASDIKQGNTETEFRIAGQLNLKVKIPTVGRHHVQNALCAAAVGMIYGLTTKQIQNGLLEFQNVEKRQDIFEENGMFFIDDTYNSNPDSMKAAIRVLKDMKHSGKKIIVMGDMLELGQYSHQAHSQIGQEIQTSGISYLLCKGKEVNYTMQAVKANIEGAYQFDNDVDLLHKLQEIVTPGDAILFKGSRGMQMENILRLWKVGKYKDD